MKGRRGQERRRRLCRWRWLEAGAVHGGEGGRDGEYRTGAAAGRERDGGEVDAESETCFEAGADRGGAAGSRETDCGGV